MHRQMTIKAITRVCKLIRTECFDARRVFNIGDFGTGNMEDLMNQLMEQHQPSNQPTAQQTRDSLPRRFAGLVM